MNTTLIPELAGSNYTVSANIPGPRWPADPTGMRIARELHDSLLACKNAVTGNSEDSWLYGFSPTIFKKLNELGKLKRTIQMATDAVYVETKVCRVGGDNIIFQAILHTEMKDGVPVPTDNMLHACIDLITGSVNFISFGERETIL